ALQRCDDILLRTDLAEEVETELSKQDRGKAYWDGLLSTVLRHEPASQKKQLRACTISANRVLCHLCSENRSTCPRK
ncbi:MAG TPA: hypothetical protein VIP09_05300, partial [Dehalococcoidia bacterium]